MLQSILRNMAGKRALLIGDLMLDAYIYGETGRVSREAPVLVVRKERLEHRLGGAANTAANLVSWGVQTEVVGVVGHDAGGVKLRQMLQLAGANVGGVLTSPRTTPVKTRVLAGAVGTSRQQVLRLDDEPQTPVDAATLERMAQTLRERAIGADVILVSDYGVGTVIGAVLETLLQLAREGKTICVDSRFQLAQYRGVVAVTPNVPEAEGAVGFSLQTPQDLRRAGQIILDMLGCKACLITQGRLGMTLFRPNMPEVHVHSVGEMEVTDVTGAGDTVIATLGAALAAGLGFETGMMLANCAAGVVVTKMGAACASAQEVTAAAERGGIELAAWDN